MTFDISQLGVAETLASTSLLNQATANTTTVEALARAVCEWLYEQMADASQHPACPLIRFYITHPYSSLLPDDQRFARTLLTADPSSFPNLKCLTLLGTRGDVAEWNDRRTSRGHRAIPLPTSSVVEKAPMIAQLFLQMGVPLSSLIRPAPELVTDPAKRVYNVFYVGQARGSAHIPAQQEFVERYGVESVIGFGGALPWGEHFAVILFSRVHIPQSTAGRFKSLALTVRARLLGFDVDRVFTPSPRISGTRKAVVPDNATQQALADTQIAPSQGSRTFSDSAGVEWKVWAIVPTQAHGSLMRTATPGISVMTPERDAADRGRLARWQSGWLLFESTLGSRRLTPIPERWIDANDTLLEEMCSRAKRVGPPANS
jgi:hypothetical protein